MRYTITRSGMNMSGAHQRDKLSDAVSLALSFMDGTPGLTTSITDTHTRRTYSEAEIEQLAADFPPPSKSMFGGPDA
jgi:hypothetical protein